MTFFFNTSNINLYFEQVNTNDEKHLQQISKMKTIVPSLSNTNGDVLTTRKLSFLPSFNHINNNIDTNVNKNIDDDLLLLLRKKKALNSFSKELKFNTTQNEPTIIKPKNVAKKPIILNYIDVPTILKKRFHEECNNNYIHHNRQKNDKTKNASSLSKLLFTNFVDNTMKHYNKNEQALITYQNKYEKYDISPPSSSSSSIKNNKLQYDQFVLPIPSHLDHIDDKYLFIQHEIANVRQKIIVQRIDHVNLNFQVSKFRYQSKPLHRVTRPYNTLQHIKIANNVTKQKEKKNTIIKTMDQSFTKYELCTLPYGISIYNYNENHITNINHEKYNDNRKSHNNDNDDDIDLNYNKPTTFVANAISNVTKQTCDINVVPTSVMTSRQDQITRSNMKYCNIKRRFVDSVFHTRFVESFINRKHNKVKKIAFKQLEEMEKIDYFNVMLSNKGCCDNIGNHKYSNSKNNNLEVLNTKRYKKSTFLPLLYHKIMSNDDDDDDSSNSNNNNNNINAFEDNKSMINASIKKKRGRRKVKRVYEYDVFFYGKWYNISNDFKLSNRYILENNYNFIKVFVHYTKQPRGSRSNNKRKMSYSMTTMMNESDNNNNNDNSTDNVDVGIRKKVKRSPNNNNNNKRGIRVGNHQNGNTNNAFTNIKLPHKRSRVQNGYNANNTSNKMLRITKKRDSDINRHRQQLNNANMAREIASTINLSDKLHVLLSKNIQTFNNAYKPVNINYNKSNNNNNRTFQLSTSNRSTTTAIENNRNTNTRQQRRRICFVNPDHFISWGLDVLRYLESKMNCIIHERTTNILQNNESIVLNPFNTIVVINAIYTEAKYIFHHIIALFQKFKRVDVYINAENLTSNTGQRSYYYQQTMELQRLIHSLSTVQNVQLIYYTSVAMLCKCICFKSDDLNAQMFCGDAYGNDSCDDDDDDDDGIKYDPNVETKQELFLNQYPCFNVCSSFQIMQRYKSVKRFLIDCGNDQNYYFVNNGDHENGGNNNNNNARANRRRRSRVSAYFINQQQEKYWIDLLHLKFP